MTTSQHPVVIDLCSEDDSDEEKEKDSGVAQSSAEEETTQFLFISGMDTGIVTEGLISLLQNVPYTCQGSSPSTILHIQQTDKWSCGFRNWQGLLSALLPFLDGTHSYYRRVQYEPNVVAIPSLIQLQTTLEQAWVDGYDPKGAQHYKHKLVNTRKWIGAVEVLSGLIFMGIDATVVQFVKSARHQLGPFCGAYFRQRSVSCPRCGKHNSRQVALTLLALPVAANNCSCSLLPLYLQWSGHSILIVGVEQAGNGATSHLITLDPMQSADTIRRNRGVVRKPLSHVHSVDTQVICLSTAPVPEWSRELSIVDAK